MSEQTTGPAPVEAKVKAATAGAVGGAAGAAAVLTPALVWAADQLWWNGDGPPNVPLPVVGVLGLAATGVCAGVAAFKAGYRAKHTARGGAS